MKPWVPFLMVLAIIGVPFVGSLSMHSLMMEAGNCPLADLIGSPCLTVAGIFGNAPSVFALVFFFFFILALTASTGILAPPILATLRQREILFSPPPRPTLAWHSRHEHSPTSSIKNTFVRKSEHYPHENTLSNLWHALPLVRDPYRTASA